MNWRADDLVTNVRNYFIFNDCISKVIFIYNRNDMAILKFSELSWQDKQIAAIIRLSRARGWSFGDNNPYFERVLILLHNPKIKNKQQMNVKKMDIDKFKSVAVRKQTMNY
jgi:hypothetical protein